MHFKSLMMVVQSLDNDSKEKRREKALNLAYTRVSAYQVCLFISFYVLNKLYSF